MIGQAHIIPIAHTITPQVHIGTVPIIIPQVITVAAMIKAITTTTTTITTQRITLNTPIITNTSVASRNTRKTTRMVILWLTRDQPMRLSVREETRLLSLQMKGYLSLNRRTPPSRIGCCNPLTTQQAQLTQVNSTTTILVQIDLVT